MIGHTNIEEIETYLTSSIKLPQPIKKSIIYYVKYLVENYYSSLDSLVLFGSCARGTCKINSDIDLLILTKDEISEKVRLDIRYELLDNDQYVSCDTVFYTYDMFRDSKKLLVKKIKEEGLLLWKKEETLIMG